MIKYDFFKDFVIEESDLYKYSDADRKKHIDNLNKKIELAILKNNNKGCISVQA